MSGKMELFSGSLNPITRPKIIEIRKIFHQVLYLNKPILILDLLEHRFITVELLRRTRNI